VTGKQAIANTDISVAEAMPGHWFASVSRTSKMRALVVSFCGNEPEKRL
jgi:hypothetical protein